MQVCTYMLLVKPSRSLLLLSHQVIGFWTVLQTFLYVTLFVVYVCVFPLAQVSVQKTESVKSSGFIYAKLFAELVDISSLKHYL